MAKLTKPIAVARGSSWAINKFGNCRQQLERTFAFGQGRVHVEQHWYLFGNNDDADGRQHPVNGGEGKNIHQTAQFEDPEQDLDDTGHYHGAEGQVPARVAATQIGNGSGYDDDKSGSRAFDG